MDHNQFKFHFVNKTSLSVSLSRSQGKARFEIFRHAKLKSSKSSKSQPNVPGLEGNHGKKPQIRSATSEEDWEDIPTTSTATTSTVGLRRRGQRGPVPIMSPQNFQPTRAPALTYLEGSCDPFGAQGIVITPKINQLIGFIRDSYIPALYVTPFMRTFSQECPRYTTIDNIQISLGGTCAVKNWHHLRKSLCSDGGASAWVASWIPCILPFVDKSELREWYLTGLKMRAHSIQALRKTLASGENSTQQVGVPILLHVLYLFRADCVMGDTQAAAIHAKMLHPLIERMEDTVYQVELLVIVLYNDCELQIAKMQRTLFDHYNWVPDRLTNFWRRSELLLPEVGEGYKDLHSSIDTVIVRGAAIHLRRCLLIGGTPMRLRDPLTLKLGESVYNWMATITLWDMGTLVAVHLDLIEHEVGSLSVGKRYTEAALAIAVLQILRKSMHSMTVSNILDRRDYSHIIIPRLRSTLETAHKTATPEELLYYREAFLWMFYIGTHYEQRLRRTSEAERPSVLEEQWFSEKFIEQSRLLGFCTWSAVKNVLEMFVFNPYLYLGQSLETWFHDKIHKSQNEDKDLTRPTVISALDPCLNESESGCLASCQA